MIRRTLDRSLALMARLVVRGFFRTVEIEGFGAIPHGRPVLIVASHFNGFVDPVIVIAALGRLPRFLAKAWPRCERAPRGSHCAREQRASWGC